MYEKAGALNYQAYGFSDIPSLVSFFPSKSSPLLAYLKSINNDEEVFTEIQRTSRRYCIETPQSNMSYDRICKFARGRLDLSHYLSVFKPI